MVSAAQITLKAKSRSENNFSYVSGCFNYFVGKIEWKSQVFIVFPVSQSSLLVNFTNGNKFLMGVCAKIAVATRSCGNNFSVHA